jgi:serine phosphatase RsbU (regulator of sigma subunit)/catechol 2,3-dioxygenase-like lactoylglutathione lyase family enzyme
MSEGGDPRKPYLRIGQATLFVTDQDRSLKFFVEKLGLQLAADVQTDSGTRWVGVSFPDGSTLLELIAPVPGSQEYALIGQMNRLLFVTEDVTEVYRQWSAQGVGFHSEPQPREWGGIAASFEDPDGNTITLASFDRLTAELEAQRQDIAAKREAYRRSLQEMEIARDVQMRLFPQSVPVVSTLDFTGLCVQSRAVGGDYYDFLDFGEDRLGLVIGDVAGKGIAAALLMVSLQTSLRSLISRKPLDLLGVLRSVNERFHADTGDSAYATLFLAEYNGFSRDLRYVNCGHLCGLVVSASGLVSRLEPTGTVLGLFPRWDGAIGHCSLKPGDVLALYTDGVTEAPGDEDDDDFGEARLIESLRRNHGHSAQEIASFIRKELECFSTDEKFDDVTLIIAKVLSSSVIG